MKITLQRLRQIVREELHRAPGYGKPTMHLGTSVADEDDDGQPSLDDPNDTISEEIKDPGYQSVSRFLNYNYDQIDDTSRKEETNDAWRTVVDLFRSNNIKSPSDPSFVSFAIEELAKEGVSDNVLVTIQKRLENANDG